MTAQFIAKMCIFLLECAERFGILKCYLPTRKKAFLKIESFFHSFYKTPMKVVTRIRKLQDKHSYNYPVNLRRTIFFLIIFAAFSKLTGCFFYSEIIVAVLNRKRVLNKSRKSTPGTVTRSCYFIRFAFFFPLFFCSFGFFLSSMRFNAPSASFLIRE